MVEVKAVSSDEIFQEWLSKANMNTLKKFFEKKKVDFKKDHVSAVETVYDVSKFIVIYFEKKVAEAFTSSSNEKVEKITVDELHKYKFYDFKGKRMNYDSWKEKKTTVPTFSSLRRVDCQKCNGTGSIKCDVCNGQGLIRCDKCNGSGKTSCNNCKNSTSIVISVDVYDAENKKEKAEIKIPCPSCYHTGAIPCSKCGGVRSIYCRNCHGGVNSCKVCKGYGFQYQFKYEAVPFITQRKSAMVFYKKDVEKFIDKKEVEQLLNAKEIAGITVYNPDNLDQTKLLPELNYWTPEADKICSDAKKQYKELQKRKLINQNQKIMVFPALQLRCKSFKGKTFEVFGIGTSGSFIIIDNGFK